MAVSFILPVKGTSTRVTDKNIRPFAGSSLLDVKLAALAKSGLADEIIVSSDSDYILDRAAGYNKVRLHKREPFYCLDSTPYSEVCKHLIEQAKGDTIYWVHVTSPMISIDTYKRAWEEYQKLDRQKFDSIIGMKKLQIFLWNKHHQPVNYTLETHVYSQFLDPLFMINNSLFIVPKNIALQRKFNYGFKPYIFETPADESIDIDWNDEFEFAEFLYKKKYGGETMAKG